MSISKIMLRLPTNLQVYYLKAINKIHVISKHVFYINVAYFKKKEYNIPLAHFIYTQNSKFANHWLTVAELTINIGSIIC